MAKRKAATATAEAPVIKMAEAPSPVVQVSDGIPASPLNAMRVLVREGVYADTTARKLMKERWNLPIEERPASQLHGRAMKELHRGWIKEAIDGGAKDLNEVQNAIVAKHGSALPFDTARPLYYEVTHPTEKGKPGRKPGKKAETNGQAPAPAESLRIDPTSVVNFLEVIKKVRKLSDEYGEHAVSFAIKAIGESKPG